MNKPAKTHLHILYVEDEEAVRTSLEKLMNRRFDRVDTAPNGAEGLERFRDVKPDVLVTDIQMPKMDGLALARHVREESPETPIVFTTAFSDDKYLFEAIDIGVDKYITKPVDSIKLVEALQEFAAELATRRELETTKKLLQSIANASGEGILTLDRECRVTYMNPAGEKLLGYSAKELAREGFRAIRTSSPDGFDPENCPMCKVARTGDEYRNNDEFFFGKDGERLEVAAVTTPLTEGGEIVGSVTVFKDVKAERAAQKVLLDRKAQEIELLQYRERYHSQQQENAFKKQLKIINDQLSHITLGGFCVESYYKPLDVLSGDTYGTVDLGGGRFLLYIVDAMGKGLSASVTATLSSAYINHLVEKGKMELAELVREYQAFIKPRLLEEELIAATFVLMDTGEEKAWIANFGMPPVFLMREDGTVEEIDANNPPIMSFLKLEEVDEHSIRGVGQLLFYSDGLDERIMENGYPYAGRVKEDFEATRTGKDFLQLADSHVSGHADDLTLIYVSRVTGRLEHEQRFTVETDLAEVEPLLDRVAGALSDRGAPERAVVEVRFALNELVLNAIEHGNLGISYDEKQRLLETGEYEGFMRRATGDPALRSKRVDVSFQWLDSAGLNLLVVDVEDEGDGFSPSEIFKYMSFDESVRLHGRGIVMSESMVDAIYYNLKGNKATILKAFGNEEM